MLPSAVMETKQDSIRDGELKIKSFKSPVSALISQSARRRKRSRKRPAAILLLYRFCSATKTCWARVSYFSYLLMGLLPVLKNIPHLFKVPGKLGSIAAA